MEEQPPALLLFTKLGPVDWTTTAFLFPLFSLKASKLLTHIVNLQKGSSYLVIGILRLVYQITSCIGVCWYLKIAILLQMCTKIVSIWYLRVCLKLTIFSRHNIFFFFFKDRLCLIFGSLPEADSRQQLPSFKLEQSEAAQHTNRKTSNCRFSKYWEIYTRLLIKKLDWYSVSGQ